MLSVSDFRGISVSPVLSKCFEQGLSIERIPPSGTETSSQHGDPANRIINRFLYPEYDLDHSQKLSQGKLH